MRPLIHNTGRPEKQVAVCMHSSRICGLQRSQDRTCSAGRQAIALLESLRWPPNATPLATVLKLPLKLLNVTSKSTLGQKLLYVLSRIVTFFIQGMHRATKLSKP